MRNVTGLIRSARSRLNANEWAGGFGGHGAASKHQSNNFDTADGDESSTDVVGVLIQDLLHTVCTADLRGIETCVACEVRFVGGETPLVADEIK